jgi:hypothetical protein
VRKDTIGELGFSLDLSAEVTSLYSRSTQQTPRIDRDGGRTRRRESTLKICLFKVEKGFEV